MAEKKKNPFEKLGKTEAPASRAKSKAAAAASEEVSEEAETEEEVVAAAKERVAAKRAARSVKAKAAPEPEEIEEEEDDNADSEEVEAEKAVEPEDDEAGDSGDDEDDHAEEVDEAAVSEPVKAAPKKQARRTAKQVEEEYQAKQAELEAQIAKLTARIESGDVEGGVEVVRDRVVLEDGAGGDLRVVGASRTLVNDDWRATVTEGIKLVVGRSSAQATNSFVIPVSLAKSLGELLAEIDEIAE